MKIIFGHDDVVAKWVEQKMGGLCVFPHRAVGIIDDAGVLRGGLVLCFHNPSTADVTAYAPGVITPGVAKAFFEWVFIGCGVWRLQALTPKDSGPVKRGLMKMGFKFECVARDFYARGIDAVQYRMLAPDCRWIRNGQPLQAAVQA